MVNFIIIGDSWACGEWGYNTHNQYSVLHPGVSQYLREQGHMVHCLAKGASSNREQIDMLLIHAPVDYVLWFLTDPFRDIDPKKIPTNFKSYWDDRNLLLRKQFERVRGLPLFLIGGVCCVPQWVGQEFANIRVLCPSLQQWLIPEERHLETMCRGWHYTNCDSTLLEYFETQEIAVKKRNTKAQFGYNTPEHKWFWPDGSHPNRQAHLKITQELVLSNICTDQ